MKRADSLSPVASSRAQDLRLPSYRRASTDVFASRYGLKPVQPTCVLPSCLEQKQLAAVAMSVGALAAGGATDRNVVPLVRIEPEYPMRARQRGIEGWVVIEFMISKVGTIKNPKVLSAHPGTIFNRSALNAVRKWKYNPKIKNGQAVERPGVRVRLDFEMDR
mgnify:CR=1 FL=1